jgi:SAM-dependent methyltransferase
MRHISGNIDLRRQLENDSRLRVSNIGDFEARYDHLNAVFHSHFPETVRPNNIENCRFHKGRYLALAREKLEGFVIDVGNDKPFLTFYLKMLNPSAEIMTISFDIPQTPYDLFEVDIEGEPLPIPKSTADHILCCEVLEHLWRDPAFAAHQMNCALRPGGRLYLTTPNACELHAITCILWQANPNQRNQFYSTLESGHLHLWAAGEIRKLFESNGFSIEALETFDPYGYTSKTEKLLELVQSISPHFNMMGETILLRATKTQQLSIPIYEPTLFPSGSGVRFEGAIRAFAEREMSRLRSGS